MQLRERTCLWPVLLLTLLACAFIQPRGWLSASRLHGQVIWCAATSCLQTQHVCKAAGKTAQQTEVLQLSNSPWTFTLLAPRL